MDNRTYLLKLDASGSIDSTFGTDGIVEIPYGENGNSATNFHLLSDGKILLGGRVNDDLSSSSFIVRLNSDGTFDDTFGTNGAVTDLLSNEVTGASFFPETNTQQLRYSAIDDKIIINGYGRQDTLSRIGFAVKRYNSDGSIDDGFGIDGLATVSIDTFAVNFTHSFVDDGGNIIQVGNF